MPEFLQLWSFCGIFCLGCNSNSHKRGNHDF